MEKIKFNQLSTGIKTLLVLGAITFIWFIIGVIGFIMSYASLE